MSVAVPWIMLAVSAVGAVAAVRQGQATAAAMDYNKKLSDQNAQAAEAQGVAADEALRRDQQRKMGMAVAAYGAAGVELSDGSPADVLADSARMAALDRLTQKYNYKLRAMGYQNQATLDDASASNARTSGYFNALAAMGQGASSAIPKFGGS